MESNQPNRSNEARRFDLNMKEDLLEAWAPSDGIRELIANALDEQVLTGTDPVAIEVNGRASEIRDYGRGLRYEHFAQGEDEEKLSKPDQVIGKFGVGLKDALAVLYRHGVNVTIHSPHNTFTVEEAPKAEFDDVETLHAVVHPPEHPDLQGTRVLLEGVSEADVETAKRNFLQFTDEERIEATNFGEIYAKPDGKNAAIYVTGLRVATEPDFLFSYNITNTTKKVRDALNRERSNVGRTAYTPRVKKILQAAESEAVAERLVADLERFTRGTAHEELGWKPIRLHAAKLMNSLRDVVFATVEEQHSNRDLLDHAREDGYEIITVPDNIRWEIQEAEDVSGNMMRDVGAYAVEYDESFQYDWVDESELSKQERKVWALRDDILGLIADLPTIHEIRISETMRITGGEGWKTQGLWERAESRIIIHRPILRNPVKFAGILLHEVAHPKSGSKDQTREFERELTDMLGECAIAAIDTSDSFLKRFFP
ncbi:ATP-binding protein [Salisaeta longa]|uniref:ATP-binding protein n=1 Tax=Salisaeta longa TaxID=503170 RepID=UPI00040B5AAB|nr:ATP-binding protein [Salisaeta longa]